MKSHPGGEEHTLRMLKLSGLTPPAGILDMGAGAGESVLLLNKLGYRSEGIDLSPESDVVRQGDFLCSRLPSESYDGILSQCSFYVSQNPELALSEAYRMLRPGGVMMVSDVWFSDAVKMVEKAGFRMVFREDMTPRWREYYLTALWSEENVPCNIGGHCTYELLICSKI